MNKITLAAALMAAFSLVGMNADSAQANTSWGLSIGGSNVRLNVGSYDPYYYTTAYTTARQPTYRRSYSNPRWYGYNQTRDYYRYESRRSQYVPLPVRPAPRGGFCDTGSRRYDRNPSDYREQSRDGRGPRPRR